MAPRTTRVNADDPFEFRDRHREESVGEALAQLLFGRDGVVDQLGRTVGQVADAKRRIDRNIQYVLSVLNLPSRADYTKLVAKIEALEGSLVNLNIKLDRLIAGQREATQPKPRAPRPRPPSPPPPAATE